MAAEMLAGKRGFGKEVVLFGKGPSLDAYVSGLGREAVERRVVIGLFPLVAVNQAALVVPGSIAIAYDPTPVTDIARAIRGEVEAPNPKPVMITSDKYWSENPKVVNILPEGSTYFRRCDYRGNAGTAVTAILLLAEAGYERVHMVGFDLFFHPERQKEYLSHIEELGGRIPDAPYAECLKPFVNGGGGARREHDYTPINAAIQSAADDAGVELVDGCSE